MRCKQRQQASTTVGRCENAPLHDQASKQPTHLHRERADMQHCSDSLQCEKLESIQIALHHLTARRPGRALDPKLQLARPFRSQDRYYLSVNTPAVQRPELGAQTILGGACAAPVSRRLRRRGEDCAAEDATALGKGADGEWRVAAWLSATAGGPKNVGCMQQRLAPVLLDCTLKPARRKSTTNRCRVGKRRSPVKQVLVHTPTCID